MYSALIAWPWLHFAAPFLALGVAWGLISQTERIVHFFFPHLEWEKSLGWLNIRAERRARAALRWIGYGIDALLCVALYGITWGAEGLRQLDDWSDPMVAGELALRVPVLVVCLAAWCLYLGSWLLPKLRREREVEELKKFRAEAEELEQERKHHSASRRGSSLSKMRINTPQALREPLWKKR